MLTQDLCAVQSIERNNQEMPWSHVFFEESLLKQHRCRALVVLKKVVGFYVVCRIFDELHLLNIVVDKPQQGQGLAHMLIDDILEYAQGTSCGDLDDERIRKIFLEVRRSNEIAQNLYRQWQFQVLSVRKDYYRKANGEREDALVMVRLV